MLTKNVSTEERQVPCELSTQARSANMHKPTDRLFITGPSKHGNMGIDDFGGGAMSFPQAIQARMFREELQPRKILGRMRTIAVLLDKPCGSHSRSDAVQTGAKWFIAWGSNSDQVLDPTLEDRVWTPTAIDYSEHLGPDEFLVDGSIGGYQRMGMGGTVKNYVGTGLCTTMLYLVTNKGRILSRGCNDFGQLGHFFNATYPAKANSDAAAARPWGYANRRRGFTTVAPDGTVKVMGLGMQGLHSHNKDRGTKPVYVAGLAKGEALAKVCPGKEFAVLLTTKGRVYTAGRSDMTGRVDGRNNEFREVRPGLAAPITRPAPAAGKPWKARWIVMHSYDDFGDGLPWKIARLRAFAPGNVPIRSEGRLFYTQANGDGWGSVTQIVGSFPHQQVHVRTCTAEHCMEENPRRLGLQSFMYDLGAEHEFESFMMDCVGSPSNCREHMLVEFVSAGSGNVPFETYGFVSANLTGVGVTTWNQSTVGAYQPTMWPEGFEGATETPEQFNLAAGETVIDVSTGQMHSAMLTDKGRLFTFGGSPGGCGRKGNPLLPSLVSVPQLRNGEKIVQIDSGHMYSAFRTSDQRVFYFGKPIFRPMAYAMLPREILFDSALDAGETIVRLSAGYTNVNLLTSKGRGFSVGSDRNFQLMRLGRPDLLGVMQLPPRADGKIPALTSLVAGMEFISGIFDDGTVLARGFSSDASPGAKAQFETMQDMSHRTFGAAAKVAGTHLKDLRHSELHSLALMYNGDVYSSGDNKFGQLGRDQGKILQSPSVKKVLLPNMVSGERMNEGCFVPFLIALPSMRTGERVEEVQPLAWGAVTLRTNMGAVYGMGQHAFYGSTISPPEPYNMNTTTAIPLRPGEVVTRLGAQAHLGAYVRVAMDPTGGNFKQFDAAASKPMQTKDRKAFVVPFCAERHDSDTSVPAKQGKFCVACEPGFVGFVTSGGFNNRCEISYTFALDAAGKLRKGDAHVTDIAKKRVAFVCWLVYPGVTAMVLQFYNCNEVDGVTYLDRDYSLQCYDSTWNGLLPASLVSLALYVVAIPAWFLSTHRKGSGNRAIAQLLSQPYRKDCPYTEEGVMIFKALLWVFAIFLGNTCLTQMIVVSFTCLGGTLLVLHYKPFKHWVQNVLFGLTLFTFTTMSLLGMVLQRNSASSKCSNEDENTLQAMTTAIAICATIALGGAT
eukprot:g4610.t1